MKRLSTLFIILLLCLLICGCSAVHETEQAPSDDFTGNALSDNANTDSRLLAEFVPFECKGSYYSFDKACRPVSENGVTFYCLNDEDANKIMYSVNGSEQTLFESKYNLFIDGYVDNALYLHTDSSYDQNIDSALYRIEIEYNEENEIISSKLSLVCTEYFRLIKVQNNSLIIANDYSKQADYALFNTKNGEITKTDFSIKADYDNFSTYAHVDEGSALNIAVNALSKSDYWEEYYGFSYNLPKFVESLSSSFVVKPYYIVGSPGITNETYPEYAWEFCLDYGDYSVSISVNAVTGTVAYVDLQLND